MIIDDENQERRKKRLRNKNNNRGYDGDEQNNENIAKNNDNSNTHTNVCQYQGTIAIINCNKMNETTMRNDNESKEQPPPKKKHKKNSVSGMKKDNENAQKMTAKNTLLQTHPRKKTMITQGNNVNLKNKCNDSRVLKQLESLLPVTQVSTKTKKGSQKVGFCNTVLSQPCEMQRVIVSPNSRQIKHNQFGLFLSFFFLFFFCVIFVYIFVSFFIFFFLRFCFFFFFVK